MLNFRALPRLQLGFSARCVFTAEAHAGSPSPRAMSPVRPRARAVLSLLSGLGPQLLLLLLRPPAASGEWGSGAEAHPCGSTFGQGGRGGGRRHDSRGVRGTRRVSHVGIPNRSRNPPPVRVSPPTGTIPGNGKRLFAAHLPLGGLLCWTPAGRVFRSEPSRGEGPNMEKPKRQAEVEESESFASP